MKKLWRRLTYRWRAQLSPTYPRSLGIELLYRDQHNEVWVTLAYAENIVGGVDALDVVSFEGTHEYRARIVVDGKMLGRIFHA